MHSMRSKTLGLYPPFPRREYRPPARDESVVALYSASKALVDVAIARGAVGPLTALLGNAVERFERDHMSDPSAPVEYA